MTNVPIVQLNYEKSSRWQTLLAQAITNPLELLKILELDENLLLAAKLASRDFKLLAPRNYVDKIKKGDFHDPLLRQILPIAEELIENNDYLKGPLQEALTNPIPGLLHKYQGRVLLTITGACSINCRYCFRRHFPYSENRMNKTNFDQIINYLAQNSSIHEVILSGGDPLVATDNYLAKLVDKITSIAHIRRLRIHSRLPIMLPDRITPEMIAWLSRPNLKSILVLHINHPNEMDEHLAMALQKLIAAKITLLNQTVLLKGVNDQAAVLAELSEKLFNYGILPYYLHTLDKTAGTAHFDLTPEAISKIYDALQTLLPGYLVPKLVREKAGAKYKTLII